MLECPWGCPVWECMPANRETSGDPIVNATGSFLGRLVPLSRSVRLDSGGHNMIMGAGVSYPSMWREVAATVVLRDRDGEPERTVLSASVQKSVWREAHSIAVLVKRENQLIGGPIAFMNGIPSEGVDVWSGALVANKSKLIDTVESVIHLPCEMWIDDRRLIYQNGVSNAEQWSRRLNRAVSVFRSELHDELDRAEFRNRGIVVKQKASSHYWTAIEQQVSSLLALVENPEPLRPEGATKDNWAGTEWGKTIAHAAREAYELACPHETPRQLKAYSLGLRVLFATPVEKTLEESVNEEET